MKRIKRIITAALSVAIFISSLPAFAAVRTDLTSANAAAGAMPVYTDMIYETEIDVTPNQLTNTLFNYTDMSDSSVRSERNAYNADFTLYFGEEEAKNISVFRAYVYGSDDDERNSPITIYGSNDGVSWAEIGVIADPVATVWNETSVNSVDAYQYIKVESEAVEDEDEIIDDDGNLTAQNTRVYHQRITKAVFFEENTDEENETGNGSSSSNGIIITGKTQFSDVAGHWAEDVIKEYTDRGILSGYEDGTFRPDNGVSVAEFCRIVSAVKGINYKISDGHWALPYIREMIDSGIIVRTDYDDYNIKMKREQVAKSSNAMMAGEYYPKDLTQFEQYITDFDDVSRSNEEYVLKTYISGVLSGYEDGSWRPQREVTRAEILSILDRVFNKDMREKPEALSGISTDSPEMSYFYNAAVQVRKNANASGMQYRLYGSDAQYMEENDDSTGLKIENEIQGAQGFAAVLRYDVSDLISKRDKLKSLNITVNWKSGGTAQNALGLWFYTNDADKTDWNNGLYMKNLNGNAVAGDDLSGYNAVTTNVTDVLPTFGNTTMAVPNNQKTAPIAQSDRTEDGKYIFDLTDLIDEIIAHANENNMVELILTTVNYDDYGQDDDKPHIFLAGENAPRLNAEYDTQNK